MGVGEGVGEGVSEHGDDMSLGSLPGTAAWCMSRVEVSGATEARSDAGFVAAMVRMRRQLVCRRVFLQLSILISLDAAD